MILELWSNMTISTAYKMKYNMSIACMHPNIYENGFKKMFLLEGRKTKHYIQPVPPLKCQPAIRSSMSGLRLIVSDVRLLGRIASGI